MGVVMHQRKYALELISKTGLSASKPEGIPIDINAKFTTKKYDEAISQKQQQVVKDPVTDQVAYQKLIGKLLYLTVIRPYIAFGVQTLSQFLQLPKNSHMDDALRIVKYLKKQHGQGVLLSSNSNRKVSAYCDADWAGCPITRKSVTGFIIKVGDSLISWKAKKQTTVSRGSAESEYRSLATTVSELVWLTGILKDVDADFSLPIEVYSDSKATIQIAANPVYRERTKRIEIDCHFAREKLQ
ncbi:secreted RxLR effector protein 161-like [Lycium barbarum]|uniref:secreted RxLR effector protein 161-like n=1 Tax=Lycium barbarum TaxID=112863 RepID=UPI00293E5218|nr:secreted RxLR effector protein 161-like [Lycium barbarum]